MPITPQTPIRIPTNIKKKAQELAKITGTPLSQWVIIAMQEKIKKDSK